MRTSMMDEVNVKTADLGFEVVILIKSSGYARWVVIRHPVIDEFLLV